jgi:hypothetical protein
MLKYLTAALLLAMACASCDAMPPTPAAMALAGDAGQVASHHPLLAAGFTAGTDAFSYAAGTAGTYTVPAGTYVTSLTAHATGSGATLTMTPSGPNVTSPVAGPAIAIPAGAAYALNRPVLSGQANELGAGTTLVFAETDSYVVTLYAVGGP